MAARRPISILIAALGGQGGGVLTEWLVGAAGHAGYPAQATSIPGVAQRTGATTYYVEVFPERMEAGGAEPIFSLYPTPGDVDVIIASELLEAGRTLEMDYASPGRTTLVASCTPILTVALAAKLVPLIVTFVPPPAGPEVGLIPVTVGVGGPGVPAVSVIV